MEKGVRGAAGAAVSHIQDQRPRGEPPSPGGTPFVCVLIRGSVANSKTNLKPPRTWSLTWLGAFPALPSLHNKP